MRMQTNWNSHTWECKMVCPLRKANLQFITKLTMQLPYNPVIQFPREMNLFPHKDQYVNGYSGFFLDGQKLETSQCLSLGEEISKLWYTYTTEYYLLTAKINYRHTKQYGRFSNALCKLKEAKRVNHCIYMSIQKTEIIRKEIRSVVARNCVQRERWNANIHKRQL